MKTVSLYIAASLDGFIARKNGSIDWLPPIPPGGEDYGYGAFYDEVDTLLMGRKTYDQARTLGPWPHAERRCVVFSGKRGGAVDEHAEFVDCDIASFVRELKAEPGDGVIWLVGGAEIVAACLAGGVVDEIILTTVPLLLGEGVRLFPETNWTTQLRLRNVRAFDGGLVQQAYAMTSSIEAERRRANAEGAVLSAF